jgi:hypothetical protein
MLHLPQKYVILNCITQVSKITLVSAATNHGLYISLSQFHFSKYLIMLPPFQVDRFAILHINTHLYNHYSLLSAHTKVTVVYSNSMSIQQSQTQQYFIQLETPGHHVVCFWQGGDAETKQHS